MIFLALGVTGCGTNGQESEDSAVYIDKKIDFVAEGRRVIPWLLEQCCCDAPSHRYVKESEISESSQFNELFGAGRRTTIQCDSLWGVADAYIRLVSYDSMIVGVAVYPSSRNVKDWVLPPSIESVDSAHNPGAENSILSLVLDSRTNWDSAYRFEYFKLDIGKVKWFGMIERFAYNGDTTASVLIVPTISPLHYIRAGFQGKIDTFEGQYYHWNHYRYLGVAGNQRCSGGMSEPFSKHEGETWQYRLRFPPEYERLLLGGEENRLDTSCADVETIRVVGWVGDPLWQPHGPDDIPTLYVLDAEILSVGMPDRFR